MTYSVVKRGYACLLLLVLPRCDAFSTASTKRALGPGPNLSKLTSPLITEFPSALFLASSVANGDSRGSSRMDKLLEKRRQRQNKKEQSTTNSSLDQKAQIIKDYNVPSVRDVLAFAVPAVGVWLCVPLLSMIDTSTVGLIAGTASQAALNPAIAVINYSAKLMTFLFSGTTTMMAAAAEKDRQDNTSTDASSNTQTTPRTMKTLVGALQLSTLVGVGLGAIVFFFARQLLGALVGATSAVDPTSAMRYIQIRALGLAAAAMVGSAQTACLAQGDVRMPVYATIISACSNLVLDLILIRNSHAWIGGTAGAAWATTISQYIAAGWVVRWLLANPKPKRGSAQLDMEHKESSKQSTGGFVCKSTRGFLAGRMRLRDWLKLPSRSIVDGFAPFVIPVITTQAGRASASATIDHVVSSSLSTASVAANQILTSVYYGLVPVADSLSLAAQNFVPGITERDDNGGQKRGEQAFAMRQLLKSFLKAAGLCGLFLATIMGTLPLYAGAFTVDLSVRTLVTAVVPFIFVTCLKHGFFCASEGVLLGQKDLKFLGSQYAVYTFLIPYFLLQLKKAALAGSSKVNLVSVWQLFLAYDLFRTVIMVGRIMWLERKRGATSPAQP